MEITLMTKTHAQAISLWRYDGIYSLYDHDESTAESFMDGTHFAYITTDEGLTGYFCFGEDARISTVEGYSFDGDYLDVGLGLRPDLCGKKLGSSFFAAGLAFAGELCGTTQFRLAVAVFNERAIKVYKRAGFYVECEVTNSRYMNKFYIMKCTIR